MRQFKIALFIAAVLSIAGCATVDKTADAPGKENTASAVQKDAIEKVQVKQTVYIPNVVKEVNFYNDGYIESYISYTYDEDMTLIREDLFDSFDQILESAVYEKAAGNEVNRLLYNSRGTLQSSLETISTSSGLPEIVSSFDAEGGLQTSSEFEYDVDGNKIKWTVADGAGVVLSETVYIYEDGFPVKIEIYDAGRKMQEYFTLEYSDGLLSSKNHVDADGKMKSGTEYGYEGGVLISEKYLRPNGSTYRTVKLTNDEHGNPVKEEHFDGNGDLKDWLEREYEYSTEEILVWE